MNKKEIGEIRRRIRKDRCNIATVYGCYVSDDHKIISEFKSSVGMMPENEQEKYLMLFKKIFSGQQGKKSVDISFPTSFVAQNDPRHSLLMSLRNERLIDEASRKALYQTIIGSLKLEGRYVILLGCDVYDVPFKNKNDGLDADASEEVFQYVLCAVCPVKDTKPNLHYVHDEATFHDGGLMQAVAAPELGFMFPAFNGRSTDVYGALYYSKNTKNNYPEFVKAVFGVETPDAADAQQLRFQSVLVSALGDACDIDVIQNIQLQAMARVAMHKEAKIPEALTLNVVEARALLASCGVSRDKLEAFEEAFDHAFGVGANFILENLIETKRCEILTENMAIRVAPDAVGTVEMRKIDGMDYILVPVSECVEVNGIPVSPAND